MLGYDTQPESGQWVHWNTMIVEENVDVEANKQKIQDTLVPTLDTVRYKYIIDLCIKQSRLLPSFRFLHVYIYSLMNNFIHDKSGSNEYKDEQTNISKLTLSSTYINRNIMVNHVSECV